MKRITHKGILEFQLKMVLLFFSIITTLVILEIFLDKFMPQNTVSRLRQTTLTCYKKSAYLPYEYIPGCTGQIKTSNSVTHIKINSIGLRDKEIQAKSNKRILLVGDSFVFGYGVEDGQKLGTLLEKKIGFEVINAGFIDTGPDVSYLYTKTRGLALKPDLIVLSIFPMNDLADLDETFWVRDNIGDLVAINSSKKVHELGFIFKDKPSFIYSIPVIRETNIGVFFFSRFENLVANLRDNKEKHKQVQNSSDEDREYQLYIQCLYSRSCHQRWADAKEKAKVLLDNFTRLSKRNNIPVVVLLVPSSMEVFDMEYQGTIFNEILSKNQIEFLDLAENLSTSGFSKKDLYFTDGHLTQLGNQLASETLFEWIKKSNLII